MVRERCWKCKKLRNDVELRASDDRWCEPCFQQNEEELAAIRHRTSANSASVAASCRISLTSSAATTKQLSTVSSPASQILPAAIVNEGTTGAPTPMLQLAENPATSVDVPCIDQISQLRSIVHQQQATINLLTEQLNFVLLLLGIDVSAQQPAGNIQHDSDDHSAEVRASIAPVGQAEEVSHSSSWTEVVKKRLKPRPHQQLTSLQQSMVAAVYRDQTDKQRRESSLIVSGLQPNHAISDKSLFISLCAGEFAITPDVVIVKRIGHLQPGKVQPLLVTLRQVDQAQQLIASARQLRQSTNPAVRDHVYINPNLTRAQAEAAYYMRLHRRQVAQNRADRPRHCGNEQISEQLTTISGIETETMIPAGQPPAPTENIPRGRHN
jgi:hypothetical protein